MPVDEALAHVARVEQSHDWRAAEELYRQMIHQAPQVVAAHLGLARCLQFQERLEESLLINERALQLDPKSVFAQANVANLLHQLGRLDDSLDRFTTVIAMSPQFAELFVSRGGVLRDMGRAAEAITDFRRAVQLKPDAALYYSNYLYTLLYEHADDPEMLFAEHRAFGERIEQQVEACREHSNFPEPDRRLRIGYSSPNFRDHAVNFFVEPILASHDRRS
ncbi:MAG: tetratricopeptide repeat protein, partial [Tepidisphaeraceae bacterium]